ncbi:STAS domain-containing protein [Actinomadura flavalba]|uniref:STAS domain-containing protein n=1 Tax=Actinomadura flavalba TaxID=1120938 RepID=UPI0003A8D145|nr:STAS domain-containing protein [Actinomadura flavalba]
MEFSAGHRRYGDRVIVSLDGDLDVNTSERLRATLLDVIEEGAGRLLVDLDGVTFLDSTGLGVFVGVAHRLRAANGELAFAGGNDRVRGVFHVTQLSRIFPMHESVNAALAVGEPH